jgi:hypothetical protein
MVLVTAVCVWLGLWVDGAQRQKRAVAILRRRNVLVEYDFDSRSIPRRQYIEPYWRHQLRVLLGDDYVAQVVYVQFTHWEHDIEQEPKVWFEAPNAEAGEHWVAPDNLGIPTVVSFPPSP